MCILLLTFLRLCHVPLQLRISNYQPELKPLYRKKTKIGGNRNQDTHHMKFFINFKDPVEPFFLAPDAWQRRPDSCPYLDR